MKDKRKKLFLDFVKKSEENKEGVQFLKAYPKGFSDWERINFANDAAVKKVKAKAISLGIFSEVADDAFFKKFACDLLPNSTYCGGSGAQQPQANLFACLLTDVTNKLDKDTVVWQGTSTKWTFFNNNRWFDSQTRNKGTWSCKANNTGYIIKDDNGQVYDSDKDEWIDPVAKTNSSTGNTTTAPSFNDVKLTSDDLYAGKTVKLGDRGQIVSDIQQLLIDKGFTNVSKSKTPDGTFGNRTKRMVQAFQALNGLNDDGVVGKNTWTKLNTDSLSAKDATAEKPANTTLKDVDGVPGSDAKIMQESRKKILRNYLLNYK
jgi:hypothetical protein